MPEERFTLWDVFKEPTTYSLGIPCDGADHSSLSIPASYSLICQTGVRQQPIASHNSCCAHLSYGAS